MVSVMVRTSCPRLVHKPLSVSRILRDLKQPAAPPSEARVSAITFPFFKSPRRLNDNLCLFFSAHNVLDADKPFLVGNTPVCSKRKHGCSGNERSMKSPKTLEFDDGECDSVSPLSEDGR